MSLAGVVILFNPENNVVNNLKSYIDYVDVLYVVDNSDKVNENLVKQLITFDKVIYIKNKENMGIAYSLNIVLNQVAGKYRWLMTMDQDSYFYERDILQYVKSLNDYDDLEDVVGLTIEPVTEKTHLISDNSGAQYVERCITSGNIIKIKTAIEVGGFDEDLFIDEVDHEFCYRCNSKGYKTFKLKNIQLIHSCGEPTEEKFLGIYSYFPSNHNYIRNYYITRNLFYVSHKFPNKRHRALREWVRRIVKIILAEDDKARKLRSIFEGYKDYKNKKMGKKYFGY